MLTASATATNQRSSPEPHVPGRLVGPRCPLQAFNRSSTFLFPGCCGGNNPHRADGVTIRKHALAYKAGAMPVIARA